MSVPFTVSTLATPLSALAVTATSSNPTLVPSSAIVLGGAGENRTITITPPLNQFGTATITLKADDGSASSTDTFVLTVTNVNDPPTISPVTTQSGAAGRLVGPLAVTVGDIDSPPVAALTLTATSSNPAVVPPAGLSVQLAPGSDGSSRLVFAQTASNVTGESVITLTVSDGQFSPTLLFTISSTHFAPVELTGTPDGSLVDLAWSDPLAAGSSAPYRVEFIPSPPLAGRSTITVDVAGSTFTATTLALGSWVARVRAVTPTSLGPPSNDFAFTLTGAPSRPLNFDVDVSGNNLTFTWNPPAAGAVSEYVLEAGTVAGASNLVVRNIGLTQSFAAAAPNGTYFTRIRAVNAVGMSSPSSELSFSTGVTPPGAPRNLRVSVSGSSVLISWDTPAGGGVPGGYLLEAGTARGSGEYRHSSCDAHQLSRGVCAERYLLRSGSRDRWRTCFIGNVVQRRWRARAYRRARQPTLTSTVSGSSVTLAWSPPTVGGVPASYTVLAGSAPGTEQPCGTAGRAGDIIRDVGRAVWNLLRPRHLHQCGWCERGVERGDDHRPLIGRPGVTLGTSCSSRTTNVPPTMTWRMPSENCAGFS